jgi:hypothetical protein
MSVFNTAVQHCTRSSSQDHYARKGNEASRLEGNSKTISVYKWHNLVGRKSKGVHKKNPLKLVNSTRWQHIRSKCKNKLYLYT